MLEDNTEKAIQILKRISTLNYQIENLQAMEERYQKEVFEELYKEIIVFSKQSDLNWDYTIEEIIKIKEQLK